MKLKKSIEKAKQQRSEAKKKPTEDAVLTEEIENDQRFTLQKMRADHLELYRTCYEINFKAVPRLIWDNQRAGGVSWLKRATMQMLGKVEIFSWRRTFKRIGKQLSKSPIVKN